MNNDLTSVLSPKVSKEIMDIYIDSLKKDKEISLLVCKDKVFPLKSISNERMTRVEIGPKDVKKKCKGDDNRMYFHTHGNFPPTPSLVDHEANKKILNLPDVNYSCIAGTAGFYCTDRMNREVVYPWGASYFKSIEDDKNVEIVRGEVLSCDKYNNKYKCQIADKKGFAKYFDFSFDNISVEEAILGEQGAPDVLSQVHSPNQSLECTIMRDHVHDKATLNCFKKNDIEIEFARSIGKRCGFIDVCHPKM